MNNPFLPFVWFLAIVAMIPVALWLLKRTPMGSALSQGQMRTVAVLPLAPNQKLVTVEVGQGEDKRWLVLGVSGQQINTLHVMPPQPEAPGSASMAGTSFAEQLRGRLRAGRDSKNAGDGDAA
ncbi:flagellar biosynthetic protein FliO [Paucibacter sp. APW11]|uniref:Flagellar biosynthetic protein FliO n=1 Tax=Roseateles aquae TaxID=3077235 RepID=A0ABU3P9V7_9BURK|nr:flagellar biosynthetic protein FliO [Paucibacter sp. APW11]MDT8999357.1 flagellar biosynthetic protein FliO [Paucibacter sp. APW11]